MKSAIITLTETYWSVIFVSAGVGDENVGFIQQSVDILIAWIMHKCPTPTGVLSRPVSDEFLWGIRHIEAETSGYCFADAIFRFIFFNKLSLYQSNVSDSCPYGSDDIPTSFSIAAWWRMCRRPLFVSMWLTCSLLKQKGVTRRPQWATCNGTTNVLHVYLNVTHLHFGSIFGSVSKNRGKSNICLQLIHKMQKFK